LVIGDGRSVIELDTTRRALFTNHKSQITNLFILVFSLSAGAAPPATLTADLDGQGAVLTAAAVARGGKVRLEIRDASGELLAESPVPSPAAAGARVVLTAGALGSAGVLLETAVTGGGAECRSLWRYRDGNLSQAPVLGASGPLPDCGPPEWKYRWERPAEDAPALYTRERSRQRPNGLLREVESFRYAGFRLEIDPGRSSSWINGVEIPGWRDAVLYPRPLLDQLASRFDLSPFRTEPRLRLFADRAQGIFELRIEEESQQRKLPITAAVPGEARREIRLTVGTPGARIRVVVSGDGSVPVEADVRGLGDRLDQAYLPVTRQRESGVRVYDSAEQELAEEFLPGTWDDGKEQFAVTLVSSSPARMRFRKSEVSLSIAGAPRGVDALLLPRDGSLPSLGILVWGADAFVEMPVRCAPSGEAGAWRCETAGPGLTARRVGSRMNVR
jgi:hypothetical protein